MLSHHHKGARITVNPRFVVKYLGSCSTAFNEDTEEDFHAKLTQIQKGCPMDVHDLKKMILTITERGMSIKCPKLAKEYFFPVHRIGSCGRDETAARALLFTYKPPMDSDLECHAVLCSSKEVSLEMKDAIAWMFTAAALAQKHRIHEHEIATVETPTQSKTPPPKRKQSKPPLNRTVSVL